MADGLFAQGVGGVGRGCELEECAVDFFLRGVFLAFVERGKKCVHFVDLEEADGVDEECVLEAFSGGEAVRHGGHDVEACGEVEVDLARVVLADAGVCEREEVEVGPQVVRVAEVAAGEVGEHGEGA